MIRISFGILCNTEYYRNPVFQFEICFTDVKTIDWNLIFDMESKETLKQFSVPFPYTIHNWVQLEELRESTFLITYEKNTMSVNLSDLLKELQAYLKSLQEQTKTKNGLE